MIKETIVPITDAAEIESIKADNFDSIIGMQDEHGNWWAYKFSRDDWRERQANAHTDSGDHSK
jgi:hypothetical protein